MSRLGVGLILGGPREPGGWARNLERVERAELLGLDSVWLPEAHFNRGAMPSPLLGLASFAARTQRIRLGTTSLLISIHDPLRVAQEAARVDALSQGRLDLGLGRGFRAPLFAAFGLSAKDKRDRFDAALDAMLAAWSRDDTAQPQQRPHPPLFVAAFGRKGLLQAAARGLPYLASPLETLQTLRENYAIHQEHLAEGAQLEAPRVPVIRSVYVAAGDADARRVLESMQREATQMARNLPPALVRAASGELSERVLIGTPDSLIDALSAYREQLGLDLLIARVEIPGLSETERTASLERLVEKVLPSVT